MFIESFIELSEPICIPSSEIFAVILYRLLLIRLQNFHKLGEGGSCPDHSPLLVTTENINVYAGQLMDLVWSREVVSGLTFKKLFVVNNKLLINC